MLHEWINTLDDPRHWTLAGVAVVVGAAVVLGFFALYGWHLRYRFPYERRTAARRAGDTVRVTLATDTEPPESIGPAIVLDRSMGGVGLAVEAPLDVGTLARVRPLGDASFAWARLEVKSCNKEDRYWKLSCRFLDLPEWSVMRALR